MVAQLWLSSIAPRPYHPHVPVRLAWFGEVDVPRGRRSAAEDLYYRYQPGRAPVEYGDRPPAEGDLIVIGGWLFAIEPFAMKKVDPTWVLRRCPMGIHCKACLGVRTPVR